MLRPSAFILRRERVAVNRRVDGVNAAMKGLGPLKSPRVRQARHGALGKRVRGGVRDVSRHRRAISEEKGNAEREKERKHETTPWNEDLHQPTTIVYRPVAAIVS
jgi:hypothetical protein